MAVYQALCKPGDTVLGMADNGGGHLTPRSAVNRPPVVTSCSYGVDENGSLI